MLDFFIKIVVSEKLDWVFYRTYNENSRLCQFDSLLKLILSSSFFLFLKIFKNFANFLFKNLFFLVSMSFP